MYNKLTHIAATAKPLYISLATIGFGYAGGKALSFFANHELKENVKKKKNHEKILNFSKIFAERRKNQYLTLYFNSSHKKQMITPPYDSYKDIKKYQEIKKQYQLEARSFLTQAMAIVVGALIYNQASKNTNNLSKVIIGILSIAIPKVWDDRAILGKEIVHFQKNTRLLSYEIHSLQENELQFKQACQINGNINATVENESRSIQWSKYCYRAFFGNDFSDWNEQELYDLMKDGENHNYSLDKKLYKKVYI